MAAQSASIVRGAVLRSSALSLEGVLDRVEVGTVRREVEQTGARP